MPILRHHIDGPFCTRCGERGAIAIGIAWAFFHIVWLYRFLLFRITLYSL